MLHQNVATVTKEVILLQPLMKDKQSRKYQLTINNPLGNSENTNDDVIKFTHEEIHKRIENLSTVSYYCMSDEIGLEEKTYHTHIFIYSEAPIRFSTVKNQFPTAHIESAYGSALENKEYIMKTGKWANTDKQETSVEGTFEEQGELPKESKGRSAALQKLVEMIEAGIPDTEIIKQYPESILFFDKIQRVRSIISDDRYKNVWRDVHTTYVYGFTNTGKTRDIMERYGYENVHRITDYNHPWDTYDSNRHKVVMFEEFRSSLKIQDMLNYLDGYPCSLPARYNNKQAAYTDVYITTNIPIEQQYENVKSSEPQTWYAFLRRIDEIIYYKQDGTKEHSMVIKDKDNKIEIIKVSNKEVDDLLN